VAAVILVKSYKIFPSIHAIERTTYGEIWFPLGIGVAALVFENPFLYAIAVLHMGVADGMAAVIGVSLGKYAGIFKVFGHKKSIAGTLTFWFISFSLYMMYWFEYTTVPIFADKPLQAVLASFSAALVVSGVELVSPKGSDNILVPIAAGVLAILPTFQLII
jgi:dolichol kinase